MRNYHPWVSTVYYVAIIGLTMFSNSPVLLFISFFAAVIYALYLKSIDGEQGEFDDSLGGATPGSLLKRIAIMFIFISLFGCIINGFFTHNGATVLFYIGPNRITLEAFIYGGVMALLVVSVITWFMSFGVVMTSDKLINVFGRLSPVLGLTVSMIFRFIPLLRKRYKEIKMGQKALGRSIGETKGFINKMRQGIKEISILVSWSLEASIESADSMSARGYGLPGRTSYRIFKFGRRDSLMIGVILLLAAVVITGFAMGVSKTYYYPTFEIEGNNQGTLTALMYTAFTLLALLPTIVEYMGELAWKKSA